MIKAESFLNLLIKNDIKFYCGIPDSLLKSFCKVLETKFNRKNHIIAANEGGAIGLAIGYNLSTNKVPLVYMQNSGLGNSINPLISLVDKKIYSIPMILLIGWRGCPGEKDEPQHLVQGKITIDILKMLKINHIIIDKSSTIHSKKKEIQELVSIAKLKKKPVAIVVKKNTFGDYAISYKKNKILSHDNNHREGYIKKLLQIFDNKKIFIIATTGFTSRELYEVKKLNNIDNSNDFLVIGGMGHANQIALSIALNKKNKKIICLDGDGSLLMHLGSLAICGSYKLNNFIHIVFNNGAHLSVGGQKTVAKNLTLSKLAKDVGYLNSYTVKDINSFAKLLNKIGKINSKVFIELKVNSNFRENIGRPKEGTIEMKKYFMSNLKNK